MSLIIPTIDGVPKVSKTTRVLGIFQSDIVVRQGVKQALADFRANPWLLDFCFASLPQDELTSKLYGDQEARHAKEWFQRTDIPVTMDYRSDTFEGTCISISQSDFVQSESQIGDVDPFPYEDMDSSWPILGGPFVAQSYSPETGILRTPKSFTDTLILAPTMVVLDDVGNEYIIETAESVSSDGTQLITLVNPKNTSFKKTLVKSAKPRYVVQVESTNFKETVKIGCHAHGQPHHLTWLWAITLSALLRAQQVYFEARNFERTSFASGPFTRNQSTGKEMVWTRYIQVTGTSRNYWPKFVTDRILTLDATPIKVIQSGSVTDTFSPEDGFDSDNTPWFAQTDGIGLTFEDDD